MEVKMHFEKKIPGVMAGIVSPDSVVIELRGTPVLVEILQKLIVDFMAKQEGFKKHY